jgi:hypothetical protein
MSMAAALAEIARLRIRIPSCRPVGMANPSQARLPRASVIMQATKSANKGLNTIPPKRSRRMILDINYFSE